MLPVGFSGGSVVKNPPVPARRLRRCSFDKKTLTLHKVGPCPSLNGKAIRICPNPCPLYWGCCPAISSSDTLFFFCPQSFPESGTFPVSHLFAPDKGNTGASASASIFPVNIQG